MNSVWKNTIRMAINGNRLAVLIIGFSFIQTANAQPLSEPRIQPLPESEWNETQREILSTFGQRAQSLNVFTTIARHEELARDWFEFTRQLLGETSLPLRDRELVILRTGWLCQSEYEWGQHSLIALNAGLSEEEVLRVATGPDAAGWNDQDSLLLRAVDELSENKFVSDASWSGLAEIYSEKQMIDLVFTVGQYTMLSMALKTFGVQLDGGLAGFPD